MRGEGFTHGTPSGYTYHGCRCPACREANTASVRRWRAERRTAPRTHNNSTYTNYGCRCPECSRAAVGRRQHHKVT